MIIKYRVRFCYDHASQIIQYKTHVFIVCVCSLNDMLFFLSSAHKI